ncbi:ribonuclease H-like domain-containing protein [Tanacetum coccineum]
MKQYSESTPEGIELILWGDLKIMMESSIEVTDQGDFWNDQQDWEIVTWRLYEACGVCILEFKDGTVIHMLVERKYPLSKELLQRMLDFGLEVEVESTAALDLIRVLNSPCFMVKSWLVQDQTVLGKDYSNLLIADSLLKTIWFINAPCYGNEALASPKANGVWIAKDVKETLRSDQDLSECLNTSSMKFKESTPKKHEVKQVQQSCLGEDCWELYIPDLVPFGRNDKTKKMQKYILKQQFEGFSVSNSEELHKGYDRFQSLLSQLEIHGAGVSTEDANQKFLRVFEFGVKGSTVSSSSTQNVAFISENTSSTNDVSTAYGVSNSSGHNSQYEHTSSYFLLANQSSCPQLDHKDLEQIDEFDLEEMDLKWQVAMISMRMKKFYKKTGRKLQFDAKEPVSFDKTKVECHSCHRTGHFARECRSKGNQDSRRRDAWNTGNKEKDNGRRSGKQEDSKALVTLDGEGVDWTSHSENEQENYAFMACNSSGSDTEVTSCSKECKESYVKLKKLYDEQREQLGDASIEIQAYTQALKKVEAQLVAHQQSQLWYEEKIRFMKIDLDDKTDVLTYHKKLLAEAEKEKKDLKAKVEKWHNSSKNLNILLNSQMSARDKAGLGYGDQLNKGVLSYENEVFQSVFVSRTSETENNPVNDRYAEGMHVVPPPMTGIYIPSGPDKEIDDSQFTYGPKQSKPSESDTRSSDFNSCESNCSEETHESMPEPVVNEPKVVCEPKVWSDAPIIEEYESDSEDEHVSLPTKEQEIPSFAFINTDKHVKTPRQTVIEQNTCSQSPKPDKKDCSGLMSKKLGLGFGYTKKACFVCGSFSHLIRDCDFHEKRMAKQAELNNRMTVLTRTGKISVNIARTSGTNTVNTARHNFNSQAVPINDARKVNTVKPIVNNARPKAGFHKSISPFRKSFNRTTTLRPKFSKQKVNTAEDYPHRALQNKGIVDSGCSRHMTGNKAYLAEYQDFNGGPVAFGGSKGYITGKGKIKTGKLDFEDVCFVKELHYSLLVQLEYG